MSFTPVGSTVFHDGTGSFTVTPANAKDVLLVTVITESATVWASGLSGGGVTSWGMCQTPYLEPVNAVYFATFQGKVTATGSAVITITFSGATPAIRCAAQEFTSSTGAWAVDVTGGTYDAAGLAFPSLAPVAASGLYWGYQFNAGTPTAGATSGYTYFTDAHGNAGAYNGSCTSATQAPVLGADTGSSSSFAVMLTSATHPAVSSLRDDFTVNDAATVWGNSFNSPVIGGGRAAIPCIPAYAGIQSTANFDLTGSSAYIRAVPFAPLSTGQMFLRLQASAGNWIQVGFDGGNTAAAISQGGVTTNGTAAPYDAVQHAYWRVRESGGTLFCDTSPDASTWTNLWSTAHTFGITTMQAQVLSGHYGGTSGTLTALQNVNSGPYVIQSNRYDSVAAFTASYTTGSPYGFSVTASSLNNVHPGSPAGYPSIYVGNQYGNYSQGSPFPLPVSGITAGQVVTTCAATLGAAGGDIWDFVYDNWFNASTTSTNNATNGLEHMIWLNNSTGVVPPGTLYASGVTVGANTFDIYFQSSWANATQGTVSFQFTAGQTSCSIDMHDHIVYMIAQGWLPADWFLINVQAGFELWKGGSGLAVTSFTVSNAEGTSYAESFNLLAATYPQEPLGTAVELDLEGVWTDVTSYVLQREGTSAPISIGRGRPDESAQVNPATCTHQLNNRDGRFSVRNPTGPLYGLLGRNTPERISVPSQTTYLRMETDATSYVSTPDSVALSITGDTEIQLDMHLSDYSRSLLVSKYLTASKSWALALNADGTLNWQYNDGTNVHIDNSTVPVPVGRIAVKVTLQVNNGAGGHTITFYTAPTITGSWTQLGDAVTGTGTAGVFDSTAPVVVGYVANFAADSPGTNGALGAVYGFKLLSGIGGTVKAYANFTAPVAGLPGFTDAQGNVWTLAGTAELSGRSYRFHGELSSLPTTWDTSGTDFWVPVAAGGLLRRLGQGNAPLNSSIKRAILAQSGTLAVHQYWPCEDLQGAAAIGSAVGGPLMTLAGGTGDGSVTTTGPAFAADSAFLCSNSLPTINGSAWVGQVPAYTSNGSIVVRFLVNVQTAPTTGARIVRVVTNGTCQELSLYWSGSNLFGVAGYGASGNVFDSGTFTGLLTTPVWFSLELRPGGGSTVDWSFAYIQPGATSGNGTSGTFTGTIGNVTAVYVDPFTDMTAVTVGHISVQSDWQSLFNLASPLNAWQGELAGNRFTRLCSENGITSRIYGPPSSTVAMGAQAPQTLTALLQEIEDADHGQLYEPRQVLGLGYRPQAALYSQSPVVTIDYSLNELGGAELTPTDDDQFTRNDMTVQRASGNISGSNYRYQLNDGSAMSISAPPDGVGDYSDSKSVNVLADSQLPDHASWLVHIGTVNEERWPVLPLNLASTEAAAIFYAILAADIGDYAQVINLPAQLPPDPVKQLVYGTKEELGGYHFRIDWNAVPESPYEVAAYDDAVYGRADTDGSTLNTGITAAATSMLVSSTNTALPLWTTVAADFPFDVNVAGERITVTNITGTTSPQTFTITRAVNGVSKAHVPGEDVRLWFPPVYAMV